MINRSKLKRGEGSLEEYNPEIGSRRAFQHQEMEYLRASLRQHAMHNKCIFFFLSRKVIMTIINQRNLTTNTTHAIQATYNITT
jgi:hypothetical protein